MKVYSPNKRFLKFAAILLPFTLFIAVLVYIGYTSDDENLMTVATILLLCEIFIFSMGTRIIRKDMVMIHKETIIYGQKSEKSNYLKIILLQFEKVVIEVKDVLNVDLNEDLKHIHIQTKTGIKTLDLNYFTHKTMHKIYKHLKEVTHHG